MRYYVLVIILVCSWIAGTIRPSAYAEIRVTGSSTIFPIIQSAAEPFETLTGIHIVLQGGGSETGIAALEADRAEVSMVSRDLMPSDAEGLIAHTIGYDGIALIVNRAIPATHITTSMVIDIYTGKTISWHPITGKNHPITVISKHEGHGTKTMFEMFFNLTDRITPNAFLFHSNNEVITMVASDPNAIGYVSIGSAEHAIELKLRLKILKLNGIEATSDNVVSGIYPLRRALNLVTLGEPGAEAARFIQFMQDFAGQKYVRQHHFIMLSGVMP
jgi:phosphate transport system substrate-binding protein